jgi:cobalamin biosynthetic protein CobC
MTPPTNRAPPRHGGDLEYATAVHGLPAEGWLDLSTGVSPFPYPMASIDVAALNRLPAGDALATLLGAARDAYGAGPSVAIVATPGSEIALRLLPLVAPAGVVAIVSPTYGSHPEAWHSAGRKVTVVYGIDAVPPDATVVVVANPNNPDGRVYEPRALSDLAERLSRRGGLLLVDEAFADLVPDASLVPFLDGTGAVVLRSFGKFFGLPGLRLGFVIGPSALATPLASLMGDWPVSTPALTVGQLALGDRAWQAAARIRLAKEARRLWELLVGYGLSILGGTNLFVLVEDRGAGNLHDRLAERGIWTRVFAEAPHWIRIGLPADDAGFMRLDRALSGR